jgi:hypothetical protein
MKDGPRRHAKIHWRRILAKVARIGSASCIPPKSFFGKCISEAPSAGSEINTSSEPFLREPKPAIELKLCTGLLPASR